MQPSNEYLADGGTGDASRQRRNADGDGDGEKNDRKALDTTTLRCLATANRGGHDRSASILDAGAHSEPCGERDGDATKCSGDDVHRNRERERVLRADASRQPHDKRAAKHSSDDKHHRRKCELVPKASATHKPSGAHAGAAEQSGHDGCHQHEDAGTTQTQAPAGGGAWLPEDKQGCASKPGVTAEGDDDCIPEERGGGVTPRQAEVKDDQLAGACGRPKVLVPISRMGLWWS